MGDLINPDLNLNPQAVAFLHSLRSISAEEFDAQWIVDRNAYDLMAETYAWYNGRERGVMVVFRLNFRQAIAVIFAENRNSDSLVIYDQEIEPFMNPQDVKFTDETWKNRMFFNPYEFAKARSYVIDLVREWVNKQHLLNA